MPGGKPHSLLCSHAGRKIACPNQVLTRACNFAPAGKLRSADCIASGNVQVVVINKKEFLDLDKRSPLLAWMLDFDAVTAVLKVSLDAPAQNASLMCIVIIIGRKRATKAAALSHKCHASLLCPASRRSPSVKDLPVLGAGCCSQTPVC